MCVNGMLRELDSIRWKYPVATLYGAQALGMEKEIGS